MAQVLTLLADREAHQDVLAFLGTLDGAEVRPPVVSREDLWMQVRPLDDEEPEILGVRARTRVRLRVQSVPSAEARDRALATAVRLALRCLDLCGDGLLLDNGETAVLLRRGPTTTLNSLWYWDEMPELSDLPNTYPSAAMPLD